jgi:arylsulfatase A-like enzyme
MNRPNVVLVTVDALRRDRLSCYGYDQETSPNLDSLAAENLQFTDALSASSHTREAVPALLTSRYPEAFSAAGYRLVGPSVASSLSEAGYRTGGFHSNPFVSRAYGFDDGFDAFEDDLYLGDSKVLALAQRLFDKIRNRQYAPAETIVDQSLSWVDSLSGESPFFLWSHFMDAHGPYQPPAAYREGNPPSISDRASRDLYNRSVDDPESVTEEECALQTSLYDDEIRYVDDQIGRLLDALDDRGLLEDALVVVTADHGEAFGEHGYYGHPRRLDEELLAVPLVVAGDAVGDDEVTVPVSTLDVVPTIADEAGVTLDYTTAGESLLAVADDPGSYCDRYVFAQARGDGRSEDEGYRRYRSHGRDGNCVVRVPVDGETDPELVAGEPGSAAHERLLAFVDRRQSRTTEGEASEEGTPTASVEERLGALGYRE